MKTLIIEDNAVKLQDILQTLNHLGIYDITHKSARNPGLYELRQSFQNNDPYNLLILDMQFPIFDDEMPKIDMGIDVLCEMKRKGWLIPVIVCSSDFTNCRETFSNVIADIQYSPFVSLTNKFEQALENLLRK